MNDFKDQLKAINDCKKYVKTELKTKIKELVDQIQDAPEIEFSIGWAFTKRWIKIDNYYRDRRIRFSQGVFNPQTDVEWINSSSLEHYLFLRKNWAKIMKKIDKHLRKEFRREWEKAESITDIAQPFLLETDSETDSNCCMENPWTK